MFLREKITSSLSLWKIDYFILEKKSTFKERPINSPLICGCSSRTTRATFPRSSSPDPIKTRGVMEVEIGFLCGIRYLLLFSIKKLVLTESKIIKLGDGSESSGLVDNLRSNITKITNIFKSEKEGGQKNTKL